MYKSAFLKKEKFRPQVIGTNYRLDCSNLDLEKILSNVTLDDVLLFDKRQKLINELLSKKLKHHKELLSIVKILFNNN